MSELMDELSQRQTWAVSHGQFVKGNNMNAYQDTDLYHPLRLVNP